MIDNFSSTKQIQMQSNANVSSSSRKDRHYQCLHFCPEVECSATFFDNNELEKHIASGEHKPSGTKTSLDKVRKMYAEKMKASCESAIDNTEIPPTSSRRIINEKLSEKNLFNETGWALPIRKYVKFTAKKKEFVMQLFLKGEKTGIKKPLKKL
ncbi:hypothetical protein JTE90_022357 [Oedothorax gibbosus]|uniref:C2H2-type domain-containing protein n=1 Tax=Oedothorax gibbosus TaxID=931172 RepID=A0AAV6VYX2_9ARAC|nr:hypothetical protein JTE90_022357 [Oedothorax gibbosus]